MINKPDDLHSIRFSQKQRSLLALLTRHLAKHNYQVNKHLRLSQYRAVSQHSHTSHNLSADYQSDQLSGTAYYQGLTLLTQSIPDSIASDLPSSLPAKSHVSPYCIYKWQLSPYKPQSQHQHQHQHQHFSLCHEIKNLQLIQQHITESASPIPPTVPVIACYDEIITITDSDQKWQCVGFIMPYLFEASIKDYLARNDGDNQSLNICHKLDLAQAMASSLKQLHGLGWIHGDIKPSNFLLSRTDSKITTYLSDLSCALQPGDNVALTTTLLSGTPAYLAPECWQGQLKNQQSDIYAFGITLYEIVMGKRPFILDNLDDLQGWAQLHCQQPVPLLSAQLQEQYPALQTIIDKLLAKQISNRYQCMDAVWNDLYQLLQSR
ncbi:serine/threonine-protein kinase [Psychrobacter lutiphocae]|uniref:serine/threonine-protein kinase n=1 Tax=Psychrobacter lutiphocae TaxID=540500 RepID=UPI000367855D|nr:serine/threonine-protein kinase [Psychrobacter lutiphocae]